MSQVIVQASHLQCERDDRPLFSDLSFEVRAGEMLRIAGRNGAGKTTLMRILAGLYTHFDGQLDIGTDDVLFLGHKAAINPHLSVRENLKFLVGLDRQLEDRALAEALETVGLRGYDDVSCNELSAGQQRRVGLARLHLSQHDLWLLDEVFTAIDQSGVMELERFLAIQAEQKGRCIVFTTHHTPNMSALRTLDLGQAKE